MSDETKVPAIPSLSGVADPQTRAVLMAMKELLEVRDGRRGQIEDRFVTLRELAVVGVVDVGNVGSNGKAELLPGGGGLDYTSPPAVSNLAVTGGYAQIFLAWDEPKYSSFSHVEVWRSATDDFDNIELVGETPAAVYSDACGTQKAFYYWVRAVSKANVKGPFNAINGTFARTSDDIDYIIDQLTGTDAENQPFYAVTTRFQLPDGVTWVEPGLYIKDARIANGTIKTAMIGTAAIDDAKIANLSATKVKFGEMSGDRIELDSLNANRLITTTLAAKLAVVDTEYVKTSNVEDGAIENAKIGNVIQSTGYDAGVAGWEINKSGVITSRGAQKIGGEPSSYDYTEMTSGNVINYSWFPGGVGHQPQRALSRVEMGVINNGQSVTLPGYWMDAPRALVSPASLSVYDRDNYLSDQKIVTSVSVKRLSQVANTGDYYRYVLTGTAILDIQASGGAATLLNSAVLHNSGSLSGTAQTSPVTVPTNSTITVSFKCRGWLVDDRRPSDSTADFWHGNWNVDLLLNGVVVHSQRVLGAYAKGPSAIPYAYATIGYTSSVSGVFVVRVTAYISGDAKVNNNGTIYDYFGEGAVNYAEVTAITATGGSSSGLAQGTLNWIAIGR